MDALSRFDALCAKYIHMAKRNNLSGTTIENYQNITKSLREFLSARSESGEIGEDYVSFDDIEAWIDDMNEKGLKPSSIKQKLVTAGQLFTFATKPYIPVDLRYGQSPVSPDFYPKVITEQIEEKLSNDDIISLWKYEKKYRAGEAQFARNYALVILMLTTGLRNKEVLDLTLDNIDLANMEIEVKNGKGRKSRIVDMDSGGLCAAALENYLRLGGRPSNLPDSAPLFGSTAEHSFGNPQGIAGAERWHRATTEWLSQLVARHIEKQTEGKVKGCRSHALRHAFARLQLNATGNLAELQALMGHTSPVVTERYSHRLCERRRREDVLRVLAARDEAAEKLRRQNSPEQEVIRLFA